MKRLMREKGYKGDRGVEEIPGDNGPKAKRDLVLDVQDKW